MKAAHRAFLLALLILPSGSICPRDHANRSVARRMKLITYGKSAMIPTTLIDPAMILPASTAPRRKVPEPPMNTFAGTQFHFMKANNPPATERRATADSTDPYSIAQIPNDNDDTIPKPASSPLKPAYMFTPFIRKANAKGTSNQKNHPKSAGPN